jgi:hypothetical protein
MFLDLSTLCIPLPPMLTLRPTQCLWVVKILGRPIHGCNLPPIRTTLGGHVCDAFRSNFGLVQNRTLSPNWTKRLNPAFPPVTIPLNGLLEPPLVRTRWGRRKLGLSPTNTRSVPLIALVLKPLILTKVLTGYWAARRDAVDQRGRLRAGMALVARGEFSIVIAGLGAGVEPHLGPLSAAYVLLLAVLGPILARAAK